MDPKMTPPGTPLGDPPLIKDRFLPKKAFHRVALNGLRPKNGPKMTIFGPFLTPQKDPIFGPFLAIFWPFFGHFGVWGVVGA